MEREDVDDDLEWPQGAFVKLLAELDFLVEGLKKGCLTSTDVEIREREFLDKLATSLGGRYTTSDIKKKLWNEIRDGYKYPEENFPRIFIHGSSEIPTLDDATRHLVGQKLAHIRIYSPRPRRLKSVQPASSNEKRTKQISAPKLPIQGKLEKNRPKHRGSTRQKKPSQPTRTKSGSRKRVELSETIRTSVESQTKSLHSFPEHLTTRSNTHLEHTTPNSPFCSTLRRSARLSSSLDPRLYDEPISSAPEGPSEDEESTIAASNRMPTPSPDVAIPTENNPDYEDLLWEVSHLRQQCQKAKDDYDNCRRSIRQTESFYTMTKGIQSEMLNELERKNIRIESLARQVQQQAYLKTYLSLETMSEHAPNPSEVLSTFNDMKTEFAHLLVIPGMRMLDKSLAYAISPSSDLGDLLLSIYGKPYQKEDEESINNLLTVPISSLINALVGAAVYEWVFTQELQCWEMTKTPLLQNYRNCIASICGEGALDRLDTAAFQSIIEEERFRDVTTPRIASRHTHRLLTILDPLIEEASRPRTAAKLQECLLRIFGLAVRVRCLTLGFEHRYEFIWPTCFSCFKKSSMEAEQPGIKSSSDLVRVPLVPGFRIDHNGSKVGHGKHANAPRGTVGVKATVLV